MRNLLPSIALALTAVSGTPAVAQTAPVAIRPELTRADLDAWLDGFVPYALERSDIAGFVISVVKDGQVLLEKGYGYADVAKRVPADPERTVTRGASLSKSFTATAVMQLVEQGKLDLDADVNRYLDFTIPPALGKPITLRNLLTHTAGFEETSYKRYSTPLTLAQSVRTVPERIYPAGDIPAYSNYGVNLAGYIVQRVSGERFTDYIQRHILTPLGMEHSSFHITLPPALQALEAKTYPVASAEPYPQALMVALSPVDFPAAGLATTAADMTRFMLAHLQHGRVGDQQLLRPETIEIMHAPTVVPIPGAQPVSLGLFRTDYRGHRIIGHSGDGDGVHAEMKLLPDENVGVFIAVNSDGATTQGIFPAAFAVRAMLFQQFVDRYFPTPNAPQEPTVATAAEHARLAAGEYVWSRQQKGDYQEALFLVARFLGIKTTIRANPDGTIETSPALTFEKNGRTQTWREVGPFVWREVGGPAHLVMKVRDGQVESVVSDAVASVWVNLRVPSLRSAGLNVPLLGLAIGTLLLTVLLWPVAALIRRRDRSAPSGRLPGPRSARLTRWAALVGVTYLLGWMIAMGADAASTVGAEPWIRLLQVMGLVTVAGAAVALRNAWPAGRRPRSWWTVAWSAVVALALVDVAWFSFAFHLISARLD